MKQTARSAQTRERLLEAAAEVFAADGFRNARIQTICRRAGANIAAAHYHFGDKEGLYAAVFEYAEERATRELPRRRRHRSARGAPARAHHVLSRPPARSRPSRLVRAPPRARDDRSDAGARPPGAAAHARHPPAAGGDHPRRCSAPTPPPRPCNLCVLSVVSQCVFYRNSAPIVARLYPELEPAKELQRIADHVTRFSLAAIAGLRVSSRNGERNQCRTSA